MTAYNSVSGQAYDVESAASGIMQSVSNRLMCGNQKSGTVSPCTVAQATSSSAAGRRVREAGSSVGSEGDISMTLSPGSVSSGARENNNHTEVQPHAPVTVSSTAVEVIANAVHNVHGNVPGRWSNSDMCKAFDDASAQNRHGSRQQATTDVVARGASGEAIHEDVWRPY